MISGALYITSPKEEIEIEINDDEEIVEEEIIEEEEAESEEKEEEEDAKVEEDEEIANTVDCLEEEGVVIYGLRTCSACAQLAEGFGGYDVIESIYVECAEERDRCNEEKLTRSVPEIQIRGEVHEGRRDPSSLAEAVECDA